MIRAVWDWMVTDVSLWSGRAMWALIAARAAWWLIEVVTVPPRDRDRLSAEAVDRMARERDAS